MPSLGTLYIVTAPSGTGKGTLLKRVLAADSHLFLSISATTRTPRMGEQDGVHYYFLSQNEFERRVQAGEFLEHASYVGNWYGTLEAPVQEQLARGNDVILEIEVQGAMAVHKKRPDAVLIFLAPPSFEELERRLNARGTENAQNLRARLETAHSELTQAEKFDYIVINDSLDQAVRELSSIFIAERCRNKKKAK